MRILVSGTGHSGTCLLIEVVRGLDVVQVTKKVEDRQFFEYSKLPENYGTKLVTDNPTFTLESITEMMDKYPDLRIILSTRHPVDVFMSKIYRGQRPSEGGDGKYERISADGTPEEAIKAIVKFYKIYINLLRLYKERILPVKLEGLILRPNSEIARIAILLDVDMTPQSLEFYKNDRNKYHKKRYNACLDKSQIDIHKKWKTIHDGFFSDKANDICSATGQLSKVIKDLGYES